MASTSRREALRSYLRSLTGLFERVPWEEVERGIDLLGEARREGRTVFVVGNGGSAATAAHFATDLGKGTVKDGSPRFRVVALTENPALLTAWANDTSYEQVFAQQLLNLGRPGDLLVAFSGSGRSPNVVRAAEEARRMGMRTIGFCGFDGGLLKGLAEVAIHVPGQRMDQVEDTHHALQHVICASLRESGR